MNHTPATREQLIAENQALRAQVEAMEETLRAIQANEVDALVVGPDGRQQVYTLRGADESYRIFVETMRQGAATIADDGTILYCNQHFADMLGSPLEQTIGASVYQLVEPEYEGQLRAMLWEALDSPGLERHFSLRNASSTLLKCLLTANPLVLENLRCICLVVTDLTEHEGRLAAEAANSAKDQFLAVLSHELRTPLTPVLMAVESLERDESVPAAVQSELSMIRRNIQLETRLIDDLLDLSRTTNGKLQLHLQSLKLHELVQQVLDMLHGDLQAKRLQVCRELSASQDQLQGDAARVQQVLWNLLKNAIKFSHEGGLIQVHSSNPDEQTLCLEVRDEGVGIHPSWLPVIFNAFEQGERGKGRPQGGLGLGLTIAKAITDLHGGSLAADSPGLGRGACFTLRLPLATPSRDKPSAPAARPDSDPGPLRLLVVEDHPETARLLTLLLQRCGHHVRTAGTVASALELVAAEDFDVLLSDIGLPDASGYDLMRQVARRHRIPGVALTGYGMQQDLRRSQEAGFADHIVKPVSLPQVQAVLARVARRAL